LRNESPSRVVEIVNGAGLRAAQLHGLETVEECNYVAQRVGMTIKAFPAGHRSIENFSRYGADILLVDGPSPGAGEVFDWRLAEGVVDSTRLMVSGGLDASNVGDAIWHLHPWGVDVSTGVESSPGVKDPAKVRAFVRAARQAEALLSDEPDCYGTQAVEGAAHPGDLAQRGNLGALEPYDWQEEGC
ncbi:MAG: phosphoribosylanthranilate isomerase, partial [Actinobacteria bacterium]|nr:phosphoribosylanthranilate isomerase [Actinomycetota bacterium]